MDITTYEVRVKQLLDAGGKRRCRYKTSIVVGISIYHWDYQCMHVKFSVNFHRFKKLTSSKPRKYAYLLKNTIVIIRS